MMYDPAIEARVHDLVLAAERLPYTGLDILRNARDTHEVVGLKSAREALAVRIAIAILEQRAADRQEQRNARGAMT